MGYQSIYDRLRANGLTEAGALAMLGNWDCESNCESVRVQGDFSPYRTPSKQYVEGISTGRINRESFMKDGKGFGLAQWTFFTRKGALYDYWRAKGGSIGDEELQVGFALLELRSDFLGLFNLLKTSNDLYECTKQVCYLYENPAVKNVDARFQSANRIKAQINLNPGAVASQPEPQPEPQPAPQPQKEAYWPPRTVDRNMNGDDVAVLQSVLKARGYDVGSVDGHFGSYLEEKVKDFQRSNALAVDGVVGPMTWGKLLDRG